MAKLASAGRRSALQDRIGAAYHEAGHAVMCHLMHLRIKSISISVDELYGGETTHENPFHARNRTSGETIRTRVQVEKIVMLCLAGPLAQEKYAPRNRSRDYGGTYYFVSKAVSAGDRQ